MNRYKVIVKERRTISYFVSADDEEKAREIVEDSTEGLDKEEVFSEWYVDDVSVMETEVGP